MSSVIRIDDDVYKWLQSKAVPFEDNPNSVLRRLAGLDLKQDNDSALERTQAKPTQSSKPSTRRQNAGRRPPLATGEQLIEQWDIPAIQARFHREGRWYEHLTKFPAAYCDCEGYVLFQSVKDVQAAPTIYGGKQVEIRGGLKTVPGYIRVSNPLKDPGRPDITF